MYKFFDSFCVQVFYCLSIVGANIILRPCFAIKSVNSLCNSSLCCSHGYISFSTCMITSQRIQISLRLLLHPIGSTLQSPEPAFLNFVFPINSLFNMTSFHHDRRTGTINGLLKSRPGISSIFQLKTYQLMMGWLRWLVRLSLDSTFFGALAFLTAILVG